MSSLFDRLEDQLRGAAQAQVAGRGVGAPGAGGRRRPGVALRVRAGLSAGGRMLPAGVAFATAAAVVVAALLLLHSGHATQTPATPPPGGGGTALPLPGSPLAQRELRQAQRLLAPVQRSALCHSVSLNGRPSTLPGRPGVALRRDLGVLDRTATPADRVPVDLALEGTIAYVHDERRARIADGASVFLVPIRVQPAAGQPSVRCLDAQARAARRGAGSIPAAIRAQTLELIRRLVAFTRRSVTMPAYDSVCLVETRGHQSSSTCDSTTPRTLAHISVPPLQSGSPLLGPAYLAAVPDDVASATIDLPAFDGHPAMTLRGSAIGNVLVIPAPRWLAYASGGAAASGHGAPQPTRVEWRGRGGQVIAQLTVPRQIAHSYCADHRLQCLLLETAGPSHSSGTGTGQLQISTTAN